MNIGVALLLAVVQGLTEFLPISSSGHLALTQHWLGLPEETMLPVTVFMHFGTWLALLTYFRRELWLMVQGVVAGDKDGQHLLGCVVLANVATVAVALLVKQAVEKVFASTQFVAMFLVLTATLLFTSELKTMRKRQVDQTLNFWRALIVGIAQGISVFPGLSRSGTTIAAGLYCGLAKEQAGRFAFVVGIPAMLGANLLEAKDIATLPLGFVGILIASAVAFVTGYLAIGWALKAVNRLQLRWFGMYCLIVAFVSLLTFAQ